MPRIGKSARTPTTGEIMEPVLTRQSTRLSQDVLPLNSVGAENTTDGTGTSETIAGNTEVAETSAGNTGTVNIAAPGVGSPPEDPRIDLILHHLQSMSNNFGSLNARVASLERSLPHLGSSAEPHFTPGPNSESTSQAEEERRLIDLHAASLREKLEKEKLLRDKHEAEYMEMRRRQAEEQESVSGSVIGSNSSEPYGGLLDTLRENKEVERAIKNPTRDSAQYLLQVGDPSASSTPSLSGFAGPSSVSSKRSTHPLSEFDSIADALSKAGLADHIIVICRQINRDPVCSASGLKLPPSVAYEVVQALPVECRPLLYKLLDEVAAMDVAIRSGTKLPRSHANNPSPQLAAPPASSQSSGFGVASGGYPGFAAPLPQTTSTVSALSASPQYDDGRAGYDPFNRPPPVLTPSTSSQFRSMGPPGYGRPTTSVQSSSSLSAASSWPAASQTQPVVYYESHVQHRPLQADKMAPTSGGAVWGDEIETSEFTTVAQGSHLSAFDNSVLTSHQNQQLSISKINKKILSDLKISSHSPTTPNLKEYGVPLHEVVFYLALNQNRHRFWPNRPQPEGDVHFVGPHHNVSDAIMISFSEALAMRGDAVLKYGFKFDITMRMIGASYRLLLGSLHLSDFAPREVSCTDPVNSFDFLSSDKLPPLKPRDKESMPKPDSLGQFETWANNQITWFSFVYGVEVGDLWSRYLVSILSRASNMNDDNYYATLSDLLVWWDDALCRLELSFALTARKLLSKMGDMVTMLPTMDNVGGLLTAVDMAIQNMADQPKYFFLPWLALHPDIVLEGGQGIPLSQHLAMRMKSALVHKNHAVAVIHGSANQPVGSKPGPSPSTDSAPWYNISKELISRVQSSIPVNNLIHFKKNFSEKDASGSALCRRFLISGGDCNSPCQYSHSVDRNSMSKGCQLYSALLGGSWPSKPMKTLDERAAFVMSLYPSVVMPNLGNTSGRGGGRGGRGGRGGKGGRGDKAQGTSAGSSLADVPSHTEAHPLEAGLCRILDAVRNSSSPDPSLLTPVAPLRLVALESPETQFARKSKEHQTELFREFPFLQNKLVPPFVSQVVSAIVQLRTDAPSMSLIRALMVSLDSLSSSIIPGALKCAMQCYPLVNATTSYYLPSDIRGTVRAISKIDGAPVMRVINRPTANTALFMFGHCLLKHLDFGDTVTTSNGSTLRHQCVPLVLSAIVDRSSEDLLNNFSNTSSAIVSSWPSSTLLSQIQQDILRLHHTLLHPTHGFFDLHLIRYFGGQLFRNVRVILILTGKSGRSTEVQVLQSKEWNNDAMGETYIVTIFDNHCLLLSALPPSIRLHNRELIHGSKIASITADEGDAFLLLSTSMGVKPSLLYHVTSSDYSTMTSSETMSDRVLRSDLPMCADCQWHFPSTTAGKGFSDDKVPILPHVHSVSDPSLTRLVQPAHLSCPPQLLEWIKHAYSGQILDPTMTAKVAASRSEDYQFHVKQDISTLPSAIANPESLSAAIELLSTAQVYFDQIDKALLAANDPAQMAFLADAINQLRSMGDALLQLSGTVRNGLAAMRLATVKKMDGLAMREDRLRSALEGLVSFEEIEVLVSLSKVGVPLWDMVDEVAFSLKKSKPHDSARVAALDVSYTVLRDLKNGNALIVSSAASQALLDEAGTKYFSQGAVEKNNVDGKPSGSHRPISDARAINKEIDDDRKQGLRPEGLREPPAVCPFMADIINALVVLALKYPGIDILIFKKDIEDAFKKLHLNYADATSWASVLANIQGVSGETILLPLSLMFGGQHCPAWFGTAAWTVVHAWSKCAPEDEWLNGPTSAVATVHVDDLIAMVERVGSKPEVMAQQMDFLARGVFGPHAINVKKDLEEGTPSMVSKVLGFVFDLSRLRSEGLAGATISIPELKVDKLISLISDDFLNRVAARDVPLKLHQQIQGLMQWFSSVSKQMRVVLADLYPMCHTVDGHLIELVGCRVSVNARWFRYLEALELTRILCLDMKHFQSPLTSSLCGALHPQDQISLGVLYVILGSDATLDALSSIDYYKMEWFGCDVRSSLNLMKVKVKPEEKTERVAWAELLPVIMMLMRNGECYRNRIVLCAVDNVEAVAALNKAPMMDPVMRRLQAILVRLEAQYGLEVYAFYVNTKNNVLADDISRMLLTSTAEDLQLHIDSLCPGLVQVRADNELSSIMDDMAQPFALLKSDSHSEAKSLSHERYLRFEEASLLLRAAENQIPDASEPPSQRFTVTVVNAGLGQTIAAAESLGGMINEVYEECAAMKSVALSRCCALNASPSPGSSSVDIVWLDACFASRRCPKEVAAQLARLVADSAPILVVCVLRKGDSLFTREVKAVMEKLDYDLTVQSLVSSDLHCKVHCERTLLHYEMSAMVSPITPPLLPMPKSPGGRKKLANSLEPVDRIPAGLWCSGKLSSAPPVSAMVDRVPLAGYIRIEGSSYPLQDISRVAEPVTAFNRCAIAGIGGKLILDTRKPESVTGPQSGQTAVRPLMVSEVSALLGVPKEVMSTLNHACQDSGEDALFWLGSCTGIDLVTLIMSRCAHRLDTLRPPLPLLDRSHLLSLAQSSFLSTHASGGPSSVNRNVRYHDVSSQLHDSAYYLIDASITQSSHVTYHHAFKHWIEFRKSRSEQWFLTGAIEDEMTIVKFIAWKGLYQHYRWNSIHVMLFAMRFHMLRGGHGDPLSDKVLVKVAMKGLKRIQGGPVRKVPATLEMIRLVADTLDLTKWRDLVLLTAIMFMFTFLLRSREVVGKNQADPRQCVRVSMVRFFKNDVEVFENDIQHADEVGWMSFYSKADPNGQGGTLNVFKVDHNPLCVVCLLQRMQMMNPTHFKRAGSFLFEETHGKVVHRDRVVKVLSAAARSMGLPEKAVSVISLRSGGATALWSAGYAPEEIKKRGRWASECWKVYVWEGNDRAKNVARDMLDAKVNIRASLAYYLHHS